MHADKKDTHVYYYMHGVDEPRMVSQNYSVTLLKASIVFGCWFSLINTNKGLCPWVGDMIVNGYSGVGWRHPICSRIGNDGNTKI